MRDAQIWELSCRGADVTGDDRKTGSEGENTQEVNIQNSFFFLMKTCQRPKSTIGSVGPDRVSQAVPFKNVTDVPIEKKKKSHRTRASVTDYDSG